MKIRIARWCLKASYYFYSRLNLNSHQYRIEFKDFDNLRSEIEIKERQQEHQNELAQLESDKQAMLAYLAEFGPRLELDKQEWVGLKLGHGSPNILIFMDQVRNSKRK